MKQPLDNDSAAPRLSIGEPVRTKGDLDRTASDSPIDEAELLRTVLAAPEDADVRRVYGDALLRRGDARGELIQVQCDLEDDVERESPSVDDRARRTALLRQEAALTAKHERQWHAPISRHAKSKHAQRPTFRRGMIERLSGKAYVLVANAADIVAREPVTDLRVFDIGDFGKEMMRSPLLRGVRELRTYGALDLTTASALFSGEVTPALERLHLPHSLTSPSVINELTKSDLAARIRALHFGTEEPLDNALMDQISRLPLRSLGLRSRSRDRELPIAALAKLQLEELDLGGNSIDDNGISAIVEAPFASCLRSLGLNGCRPGAGGIRRLGALSELVELDLEMADVGPELIENDWPKLESLRIDGYHTDAAHHIAKSQFRLRSLALRANKEQLSSIAGSSLTKTLRRLELSISDDSPLLELGRGHWPELEEIRIPRGLKIGPPALAALGRDSMPALARVYLHVQTYGFERADLNALRDRIGRGGVILV